MPMKPIRNGLASDFAAGFSSAANNVDDEVIVERAAAPAAAVFTKSRRENPGCMGIRLLREKGKGRRLLYTGRRRRKRLPEICRIDCLAPPGTASQREPRDTR